MTNTKPQGQKSGKQSGWKAKLGRKGGFKNMSFKFIIISLFISVHHVHAIYGHRSSVMQSRLFFETQMRLLAFEAEPSRDMKNLETETFKFQSEPRLSIERKQRAPFCAEQREFRNLQFLLITFFLFNFATILPKMWIRQAQRM